jgi:hypothetical protein
MKKETAYSALWNHMKFITKFESLDNKTYFNKNFIFARARQLGLRHVLPHAKRYLNQFVANGTVSKKAGCYRIKSRYMNLIEPKPRVKAPCEKEKFDYGIVKGFTDASFDVKNMPKWK